MEEGREMRLIHLDPIMLKTIWAGSRLKKIRGYDDNEIGIIREVSTYKDSESKIINSEYEGQKITELIRDNPLEVIGKDSTDQLIRVAYIDSKKPLSVQVHPNKELAESKGDYEKTETWYILDCPEDSYLIAGASISDKEKFIDSAEDKTIEDLLEKIYVKQGDLITIPAGLVHACGADMLALEIGSFGGITYRIYDYGSNRPLHLEGAKEALDLSLKPEILRNNHKNRKVVTREYVIEIINVDSTPILINKEDKYNILINVGGNIVVDYDGTEEKIDYTRTVLIPASIEEYRICGKGTAILVYRP